MAGLVPAQEDDGVPKVMRINAGDRTGTSAMRTMCKGGSEGVCAEQPRETGWWVGVECVDGGMV